MQERVQEEPRYRIDVERFVDHLSETLSIELFAAETYLQYAQQTQDLEIRRTLQEFSADSDRHRVIVSNLIADLGGRPNRLKEIATTTLAWGKGFMDISRRGRLGMLRNLQDLLMAEYKDHASWDMIKAVGEATNDQRVIEAANKVLPDEQKHVDWLHGKVVDLAKETMIAVHPEVRPAGPPTGTPPATE